MSAIDAEALVDTASSCCADANGTPGGNNRISPLAFFFANHRWAGSGAGASFRSAGVLFELYRAPSQEAYVLGPKLPLSLADFHAVGRGMRATGEQRELLFRAKSANYSAIAWIGTRASKSDRDDLTGVISSIQVAK